MRFFKQTFLMLLLAASALSAAASDQLLNRLQPRGLVNDFANIIPAAEESQILSMLTEVRQKTGAELAVVTLPSLKGGEIDDFTNRLFERWGIGQKGKDNGLLFLAAMKDRKMRIEVGYGLEGAIPDATAGRIRRDIITPHFKAGNPARGIAAGMAALSQEVATEYGVELTGMARYQPYLSTRTERKVNPVISFIFFIGFIIFAIRHPFLAMMLLSGGRGGGYRSGGGGFGGGGGGFGGGMSGGGGSSGGW